MRKLIVPLIVGAIAIAGCGKTYGNVDCVETLQTKQGDRPSIVRTYTDENHNGTADTIREYICRTRPGSLGMDEDCWVDVTHLLNNNHSNYHAMRVGGRYSEVGKGTPAGEQLQGEFKACMARGSE